MRSHTRPTMMWLRLRSRGCAAFALFAMALQIFATFGHVHLTDGSSFATVKSVALAKAQAAKAALSDSGAESDAVAPPPGGDNDPLCPLCLIGHLAGTALASSVPALPLPIVYASFDPPRLNSAAPSFDIQTSFWSRGPPAS